LCAAEPADGFLVEAPPRTVAEPAPLGPLHVAEEDEARPERVALEVPGRPGEAPEFAEAPVRLEGRSRKTRWLWGAAALVAIAAVSGVALPHRPQRLELQAYAVRAGQMRIEWNRRSAEALGASSGLLEIQDGAFRLSLPLNADQLRSSNVTYANRSANVAVRLRVEPRGSGAPALDESVRYTGSPAPPPPPETLATTPQRSAMVKNLAPQALPAPERVGARERAIIEAPDVQAPSAGAPLRPAPEESAPQTPPRRLAVIPSRPLPETSPVLSPAPPPLAVGAVTPRLPLSLPGSPPVPPAYAGPRSGRLIWTGALARRGVVEIEGSRASLGSLAGFLPGVPVSLDASPAEFDAGGLVVHTADAAKHGRAEPAGPGNGWNRTRFAWDPQRAGQVAVLEAPNSSNQFKRLTLRCDARNCPVIVIEWSVQ
jgi:hypothetical protein